MIGFLIWVAIGYLSVFGTMFVYRKRVLELWNDPYSADDVYRPLIFTFAVFGLFFWPLILMAVPIIYVINYKDSK